MDDVCTQFEIHYVSVLGYFTNIFSIRNDSVNVGGAAYKHIAHANSVCGLKTTKSKLRQSLRRPTEQFLL